MKNLLCFCILIIFSLSANAEDYFRQKWFDYPDPLTLPKTTVECVKQASLHLPCPTWSHPKRMCLKSGCSGHKYTVEALRIEPTFVISGPSSPDAAIKEAVMAIVATCGAIAIDAANVAVVANPSPEPSTRIAIGATVGVGSFKTCILTMNTTSAIAGVLGLLNFKIETPSHWARL